MNLPTHFCRNRVYRQGVVKRCNRPTFWNNCKDCTKALEEQKARIFGLSEAKTKSPPNKFDKLKIDDSFKVYEDYDDKDEPGDKVSPRNDLETGPEGETGSKKSPYLK